MSLEGVRNTGTPNDRRSAKDDYCYSRNIGLGHGNVTIAGLQTETTCWCCIHSLRNIASRLILQQGGCIVWAVLPLRCTTYSSTQLTLCVPLKGRKKVTDPDRRAFLHLRPFQYLWGRFQMQETSAGTSDVHCTLSTISSLVLKLNN
jgi:hypothetical protein